MVKHRVSRYLAVIEKALEIKRPEQLPSWLSKGNTPGCSYQLKVKWQ